jgi:hypothetical protein
MERCWSRGRGKCPLPRDQQRRRFRESSTGSGFTCTLEFNTRHHSHFDNFRLDDNILAIAWCHPWHSITSSFKLQASSSSSFKLNLKPSAATHCLWWVILQNINCVDIVTHTTLYDTFPDSLMQSTSTQSLFTPYNFETLSRDALLCLLGNWFFDRASNWRCNQCVINMLCNRLPFIYLVASGRFAKALLLLLRTFQTPSQSVTILIQLLLLYGNQRVCYGSSKHDNMTYYISQQCKCTTV